MNIEILNFYPAEIRPQTLKGTLHVIIKLADNVELNIRGVLVSRQGERWFFRMPIKIGNCLETGKSVTYPVVTFNDAELNKALINAIYEKAPSFIEEYLKMNPLPLQAQKTIEQPKPKVDEQKRKEAPANAKMPMSSKPNPFEKMASTQFIDPPKRKPMRNNAYAKR